MNLKPYRVAVADNREITIREGLPDDAAPLIAYVTRVGAESDNLSFGAGEFSMTEEKERAFLQSTYETDNHLCLLALCDDTIIGTLTFAAGQRPRVRHTGMFGMSVAKEWWGKGVGGALIDALIDWAREFGIVTKINLTVRVDNERGIRLYERKGFVREGTITREMSVNGEYVDAHMMGLQL